MFIPQLSSAAALDGGVQGKPINAVRIGNVVRIRLDRESILNGKQYVVADVIRSVFDRAEVLSVVVDINGKDCSFYPECCTIVG